MSFEHPSCTCLCVLYIMFCCLYVCVYIVLLFYFNLYNLSFYLFIYYGCSIAFLATLLFVWICATLNKVYSTHVCDFLNKSGLTNLNLSKIVWLPPLLTIRNHFASPTRDLPVKFIMHAFRYLRYTGTISVKYIRKQRHKIKMLVVMTDCERFLQRKYSY